MRLVTALLVGALCLGGCSSPPDASSSGPGAGGTAGSGATGNGGTGGSGVGGVDAGPPPIGSTLTTVEVTSTAQSDQQPMPITFGQTFRPGDVPAGATLGARTPDGTAIALQVDAKAHHADGSLRHAVLSAVVPALGAGKSVTLELVTKPAAGPGTPLDQKDLLAAGFDARVSAKLSGTSYTASARSLLASKAQTWIAGPIATEWRVHGPLTDGQGNAHPHLTAWFDVLAYAGMKSARVSVAIENDWAYVPSPQNFTYDASVEVGGQTVYQQNALEQYAHSRWRRVAWWGTAPRLDLAHDAAYLQASLAVPAYDLSLKVGGLDKLPTTVEPMQDGLLTDYMPQVGAQDDIGPVPLWTAMYLISMDPRAKAATLANGDAGGSYSIHYRDQKTGKPLSIVDHPYATLLGNPADAKSDLFPDCSSCSSPLTADDAHQPSIAYVPYLVTGDPYYLDELQFWAAYDLFLSNPAYRDLAHGLLKWAQVRGQAWALRTIARTAYITPDDDPMKKFFNDRVADNIDWYVKNAQSNQLGTLETGYAYSYDNGRGIAPWQDDFFTYAVGNAIELGFDAARPLLAYKAKFPVGRMTDSGFCWLFASLYTMDVRDAKGSPVYDNFTEVLKQSVDPAYLGLACDSPQMIDAISNTSGQTWKAGEMVGYPDNATGYPANMQPALAVSADSGAAGAAEAWKRFAGASVRPDYSKSPQFDVVPRTAQ